MWKIKVITLDPYKDNLEAECNKIAQQGWELVTTFYVSGNATCRCFFKKWTYENGQEG